MHSGAPSSFDSDLPQRPAADLPGSPRVLSAAYRTGRPGEKGSPHRSGPQPQISAFRPVHSNAAFKHVPFSSRRRKRVTIKVVSRPRDGHGGFRVYAMHRRTRFLRVCGFTSRPFACKAFQPGRLVGITGVKSSPRYARRIASGTCHERPFSAPGNGDTGACYELSPSNSCACYRRGANGECFRLHGCTGVSARAHPAVCRVPFPSVSEERGKGCHPVLRFTGPKKDL